MACRRYQSRSPSSVSAADRLVCTTAIIALTLLDRRAWDGAVGAEHTTVAVLWLEQCLARRALIEVLTRVSRHGLDRRGPTLGTGQRRLENDIHSGDSTQKVNASRAT